MMSYHNFQLTIKDYAALGRDNDFPTLDCCPMCLAKNDLIRHGFYERNAIEADEVYRIPICRLLCSDCGRTISILPTCLLPYFQHTMETISDFLLAFWLSRILLCSRQLRYFYEKRSYGNLKTIELFFREQGDQQPFPSNIKEKAIKLFQMILDFGKSSFVRRWWGHRVTSFMAHSVYHGTRVVKTF